MSQGVPFIHAGDDLLRSKSLDRDSYNSGGWREGGVYCVLRKSTLEGGGGRCMEGCDATCDMPGMTPGVSTGGGGGVSWLELTRV